MPGDPVGNHEIEERLGQLGNGSSFLKDRMLTANGITTRHYALDEDGRTTHLNEELAANAILAALKDRDLGVDDVTMIAAGTTQGDVSLPGFASMVHGRLGGETVEAVSHAGVCCSGAAALISAVRAVQVGSHDVAVAVASEQVSRSLKSSRYAWAENLPASERFDAEFLRWMLSDGAGAVVVEPRPRPDGISLRVDWTHMASHANRHETCMYSGMRRPTDNVAGSTWLDQPTIANADLEGLLAVRQDVRQLPRLFLSAAEEWVRLAHSGLLDPHSIDHVLCHYSSEQFRSKAFKAFDDTGFGVPEERWFSNLSRKGNTGAASIYIMLEEAYSEAVLLEGDRALLVVPESGRFSMAFAQLSVVESERRAGQVSQLAPRTIPARLPADTKPVMVDLTRSVVATSLDKPSSSVFDRLAMQCQDAEAAIAGELSVVEGEFYKALNRAPIMRRLYSLSSTTADHERLIAALTQLRSGQTRWLARAASNFSDNVLPTSLFVDSDKGDHSTDQKFNAGWVALSAYAMDGTSRPDPIDTVVAMLALETILAVRTNEWLEHMNNASQQLCDVKSPLPRNQSRAIVEILSSSTKSRVPTSAIVDATRVATRLFVLQLEELDAN